MDYQFKQLVGEAKAGSQNAQEELLTNMKPLLLSAVKRYGWGLDSEEMLQEANLAVLEGIKSYDESRSVPFLMYIKTKVYFHIYNLSRKQRVMYSLNTSVDAEEGQDFLDLLADEDADPLDDILFHEQISAIESALDDLNPRQRQIILLHFYQGITLKFISGILGVSYKTVLREKEKALNILSSFLVENW